MQLLLASVTTTYKHFQFSGQTLGLLTLTWTRNNSDSKYQPFFENRIEAPLHSPVGVDSHKMAKLIEYIEVVDNESSYSLLI